MGLDSVELVMAVEEKFGISISDEEAQNVTTVADLQNAVVAKLRMTDQSTCLSQRAFHLIRGKAMGTFGLPRRNVRPETPLDDIIPRANRRESWHTFQASLGVAELPALRRPTAVSTAIVGGALAVLVGTAWYDAIAHPFKFGAYSLLGAVAAILIGWLGAKLTDPMKTEMANGYSRVRDLARFLVARYPQLVGRPRTTTWTREEVWCLLRDVIIEQTGVTEFNENSRIVADLGLD